MIASVIKVKKLIQDDFRILRPYIRTQGLCTKCILIVKFWTVIKANNNKNIS